MYRCPFCHGDLTLHTYDTIEANIDDKKIVITGIPAEKCESCGETFHDEKASRYIDQQVAEKLDS